MTAYLIAAASWFAICGVPLIWTDIKNRRLPNAITIPAYPGTLILLVAVTAVGNRPDRLLSALLSGFALAVFYLTLALGLPGGVGIGDAKLSASLGTLLGWLGWRVVLTGTFAAFALAAIYGIGMVLARHARLGQHIPFAPFMIVSALAAITAANV